MLASLQAARQATFGGPLGAAVGAAVGAPEADGAGEADGAAVAVAVPAAVAAPAAVALAAGRAGVGTAGTALAPAEAGSGGAVALGGGAAAPAGVHLPDQPSQSPTATITIAPEGSRLIVPSQPVSVVKRHVVSSVQRTFLKRAEPEDPGLTDPPAAGVPAAAGDGDAPAPVTAIPVGVTWSSSVRMRAPAGSASWRA